MTRSPTAPLRRLAALVLAPLILTPLLLGLAACGGGDGTRLSRSDARYALEVLEKAPDHGFPEDAFNVAAIRDAQKRRDPKAEPMLRAALVDYARAQHGLLIAARNRPADWGAAPAAYDAGAELAAAIRDRQVRAWIDAQPATDPLYTALQQAYAAQRAAGTLPQGSVDAYRATLERLRWLPRTRDDTRIDVNIASATLAYIVDGQARMTMRTATGRRGDETPTLTSKIDHIVLNPPWNVPDGIADEELRPKGGAYLAANRFVTKEDGRLQQLPGPDSALGLVKFDFVNPYAVYLHDTPAKAAFDRQGRAVSHGCVRLEHALDLAAILLQGQPDWSPARIQQVIAEGETTTVKLANPVPVRLMYMTAVPSGAGATILADVYGWDAEVVRRLDAAAKRTAT